MGDKMYWAAKCSACSRLIPYRDVSYTVIADGTKTEDKLPNGTARRRCDHCGTLNEFDLRQLQQAPLRLLLSSTPWDQRDLT